METFKRSSRTPSLTVIYGQVDGLAKTSAMQTANEQDWVVREVGFSSTLSALQKNANQNGLCSKMCLASSAQMAGPRLSELPTNSKRSGMWGFGLRETFSTRAILKTGREFSLSQVIGATVPTNSILTAANCLGIIRRERRAGRGGKMDPIFRRSLFQTIRFWFSVAEASGTPRHEAIAPRYVPKLAAIKAATRTDQFYVARNLTWDECEKLMGFPEGWTVAEGDSLATR